MKKILGLLSFAFILLGASNVFAEEHYLYPKTIDQEGEWAYPRLVYEYGRDDGGGYAIRVDLEIDSEYFPRFGTLNTTRGNITDARELWFHEVVAEGPTQTWIDSPTHINGQRYTLYYLRGSGNYTIEVFFTDKDTSKTYVRFDHHFPTFEPVESTCLGGKGTVNFDFTIWSIEPLPESIDKITVFFEGDVSASVENFPFARRGGGFGWVSIPLGIQTYQKLLAGRKLETVWTIAGETVKKTVYFPPLTHVRPHCIRG